MSARSWRTDKLGSFIIEEKIMARMVFLDLTAFEVARVQCCLSKKQLAERISIHPGSLANLLTSTRKGEPILLANLCLLAFSLERNPKESISTPEDGDLTPS